MYGGRYACGGVGKEAVFMCTWQVGGRVMM